MVDVFVDTSAWYATRVADDSHHRQAGRILEKLSGQQAHLHTLDWVVAETLGLISHRIGAQEALRTGAWILGSEAVTVHPMGDGLQEAWRRFRGLEGRVSIVDCGGFALMERLGIVRAFAFDSDFASQGFQLEAPEVPGGKS